LGLDYYTEVADLEAWHRKQKRFFPRWYINDCAMGNIFQEVKSD